MFLNLAYQGYWISEFSPRARGCSWEPVQYGDDVMVFPACAGMFRYQ